MRLLLDTHVMLWWLADDQRLSQVAREMIADGGVQLLWSVVSSFELAVKVGVGRLQLGRSLNELFVEIVSRQRAQLLPITNAHCARLADLALHHRDPFDRLLIAQSLVEKIPILTADSKMQLYSADLLW